MPDGMPPLRLSRSDRLYLAAELDLAAEGYAEAARMDGGRTGRARRDSPMMRDARRLWRLAERMRGGPAAEEEGEMVDLRDLRAEP